MSLSFDANACGSIADRVTVLKQVTIVLVTDHDGVKRVQRALSVVVEAGGRRHPQTLSQAMGVVETKASAWDVSAASPST